MLELLVFLPQLQTNQIATCDQLVWGLILVIFGLFKKTVLADTIFGLVADQLYKQPEIANALDAWAGILAFHLQKPLSWLRV